MRTILIAEDDRSFREGLRTLLEREGFRTLLADAGDLVPPLADQHRPDLILLDIMLPGMSGFDVCRALRRSGSDTPIVMISCRKIDESDRVLGLNEGADDYLVKPFGSRELLARINACLRRCLRASQEMQHTFGEVQVDLKRRVVRRNGVRVLLTAKEFSLLEILISRKGQLVHRDELLHHVWSYRESAISRTLDTHIFSLRKKLEADPSRPEHILAERGFGYRLI